MKRQFARLIVEDIRALRQYRDEQHWDMYSFKLNSVSSRIDLAYELKIISLNRWSMLRRLVLE